jgi:hypothetical protein
MGENFYGRWLMKKSTISELQSWNSQFGKFINGLQGESIDAEEIREILHRVHRGYEQITRKAQSEIDKEEAEYADLGFADLEFDQVGEQDYWD